MDSFRRRTQTDEVGSPVLAVARRRWWVIALTLVFSVGVAVAGLSVATPKYQGTATLQAPIATGVQTPGDLSTYIDTQMNTYTQLAQQPSLGAEVSRQLGLRRSPSLSVSVEPNTELLQLSATDPSAAVAARTANVAADVLVARAGELARAGTQAGERTLSNQLDGLASNITALRVQLSQLPSSDPAFSDKRLSLQQSISGQQADYEALVQQRAQLQLADAVHDQTLSIVQSASIPSSPASPKWPPVLALAVGLGLLGGLAITFMTERFAPRLYTVGAIETAAEADVLAAIPRVTGKPAESSLYNGGSAAQEAFGMLAVHILADASKRTLRTILVTSRSQGDGKSTVASNLAAELARTGRRVLLIDGDMRSPSTQEIFGTESALGLSDLLENPARTGMYDEFILHSDEIPNLGLLLAGSPAEAPARLLASKSLGRLVADLTEKYDFIIFDAPPLVVSDPLWIARLADLVLLIVGVEAADREVQVATKQLSGIGADRVSVVVNRWRGHEAYGYYAYGARS